MKGQWVSLLDGNGAELAIVGLTVGNMEVVGTEVGEDVGTPEDERTVGESVGEVVGSDGAAVGAVEVTAGTFVTGCCVAESTKSEVVGVTVGWTEVGEAVGALVVGSTEVGEAVGALVGSTEVGEAVGALVG